MSGPMWCCTDHQMGALLPDRPCNSERMLVMEAEGWQSQVNEPSFMITAEGGLKVFVVKTTDNSCHARAADGQMVALALPASDGARFTGERDPWKLIGIFAEILARELPRRP